MLLSASHNRVAEMQRRRGHDFPLGASELFRRKRSSRRPDTGASVPAPVPPTLPRPASHRQAVHNIWSSDPRPATHRGPLQRPSPPAQRLSRVEAPAFPVRATDTDLRKWVDLHSWRWTNPPSLSSAAPEAGAVRCSAADGGSADERSPFKPAVDTHAADALLARVSSLRTNLQSLPTDTGATPDHAMPLAAAAEGGSGAGERPEPAEESPPKEVLLLLRQNRLKGLEAPPRQRLRRLTGREPREPPKAEVGQAPAAPLTLPQPPPTQNRKKPAPRRRRPRRDPAAQSPEDAVAVPHSPPPPPSPPVRFRAVCVRREGGGAGATPAVPVSAVSSEPEEDEPDCPHPPPKEQQWTSLGMSWRAWFVDLVVGAAGGEGDGGRLPLDVWTVVVSYVGSLDALLCLHRVSSSLRWRLLHDPRMVPSWQRLVCAGGQAPQCVAGAAPPAYLRAVLEKMRMRHVLSAPAGVVAAADELIGVLHGMQRIRAPALLRRRLQHLGHYLRTWGTFSTDLLWHRTTVFLLQRFAELLLDFGFFERPQVALRRWFGGVDRTGAGIDDAAGNMIVALACCRQLRPTALSSEKDWLAVFYVFYRLLPQSARQPPNWESPFPAWYQEFFVRVTEEGEQGSGAEAVCQPPRMDLFPPSP